MAHHGPGRERVEGLVGGSSSSLAQVGNVQRLGRDPFGDLPFPVRAQGSE